MFTVKHGNLIRKDHPSPAIDKVKLSVVLCIPSLITIIANEPANALAMVQAKSQVIILQVVFM
jgi:hypothetical protein